MKIRKERGYGGHNASHKNRAQTFRRTHSVGQIVHGRLLRWEQPGLGWVSIDNQPLLASLSSRPSPGALLSFRIQKLSPEIVLQEISGNSTKQGQKPFSLLKNFNTLRTQFEEVSTSIWKECTQNSPDERFHTFVARLEDMPEPQAAFIRVSACVAQINKHLQSETTFGYWPWLIPGAIGQATTLNIKPGEQPFHNMLLEFESEQHGLTQIQIFYRHPQASYQIFLQHNVSVISEKNSIIPLAMLPPEIDIHCMKTAPLPSSRHGGLLASLLLKP